MPRQLLTNSPALAARLFVGLGIASLCSAVLAGGTAGILRYGPQLSGAPPQSLPLLGDWVYRSSRARSRALPIGPSVRASPRATRSWFLGLRSAGRACGWPATFSFPKRSPRWNRPGYSSAIRPADRCRCHPVIWSTRTPAAQRSSFWRFGNPTALPKPPNPVLDFSNTLTASPVGPSWKVKRSATRSTDAAAKRQAAVRPASGVSEPTP